MQANLCISVWLIGIWILYNPPPQVTGQWNSCRQMWGHVILCNLPQLLTKLPPPRYPSLSLSPNLSRAVFTDMFHSNSLPYLQCSISVNAAGVYLIAGLYWDRQLMGTVASPEVCLYSQSCFLYSCDILTTSEVSRLFQGINNGNRSPYLTFTVQTACFVVVVLYLFGLSAKGFWASLPFAS